MPATFTPREGITCREEHAVLSDHMKATWVAHIPFCRVALEEGRDMQQTADTASHHHQARAVPMHHTH